MRKSGEDYLETIYLLKKSRGVVRSIDVAHHLDYSKPSVSRAVGNLKRDGYLEMLEGGELMLTEKGTRAAERIYERHTVLTWLFTSIGVPEKTAAEDACLVEHVISEETFERLKATHADRLAAGGLDGGEGRPAKKAGGGKKADEGKKKKKKK